MLKHKNPLEINPTGSEKSGAMHYTKIKIKQGKGEEKKKEPLSLLFTVALPTAFKHFQHNGGYYHSPTGYGYTGLEFMSQAQERFNLVGRKH